MLLLAREVSTLMALIIEMFDRKCSVDCSSNNCPGIKERNIRSNIIHLPQCYNEDNLLQIAISTWESGGVQYACNAYFSSQPKSHQDWMMEECSLGRKFKCSGNQIPRIMNIPPLMAFDVVEELSCEVNDLNLIPKHIFLYDIPYSLGGCTIWQDRIGGHYVS